MRDNYRRYIGVGATLHIGTDRYPYIAIGTRDAKLILQKLSICALPISDDIGLYTFPVVNEAGKIDPLSIKREPIFIIVEKYKNKDAWKILFRIDSDWGHVSTAKEDEDHRISVGEAQYFLDPAFPS